MAKHDATGQAQAGSLAGAQTAPGVRTRIVGADDDGIRLDRWFSRHLPLVSHALIARWARTGQLRLDGARVSPGERIRVGQEIRLPPEDAAAAAPAARRAPRPRAPMDPATVAFAQSLVIHRDADSLAINKPPGLATQGGTKTNEHVDGLLDALIFDAPGRPKLVHRLDKDTSGVLLLARSARAAAHFAKSFAARSARKSYWAIIVGVPNIEAGEIDLPLAKQPGTGGEKMMVDEKEGQAAKTRYRLIDRAGNRAAWVELMPLTGRTHQLRVHMAAIGHPIVGDGKYGGKDAFLTGSISRKMHLHARALRLEGLDRRMLSLTADLPPHFAETLASLGFDLTLVADAAGPPAPPRKAIEKAAAKAHAKDVRRARKGERRARGNVQPPAAKSKKPGAQPAAAGKKGRPARAAAASRAAVSKGVASKGASPSRRKARRQPPRPPGGHR